MPVTSPPWRSRIAAGVWPSVGPPRASPTAAPLSAPMALSSRTSAAAVTPSSPARDLGPAVGQLRGEVVAADAVGKELLEGRRGDLVLPLRVVGGELERCRHEVIAAG